MRNCSTFDLPLTIFMKKLGLFFFLFALFSQTSLAFFKDITADPKHHYYTSIKWMYDNDVVEGYSDGTFKSDQSVNRAEFLKMLYSTLDVSVVEVKQVSPFTDVADDEWYTDYVRKAYLDGVVDGYSDRTFRPAQTINFAEASKIVANSFFSDKILEPNSYLTCDMEDFKIYANQWYSKYFFTAVGDFCLIHDIFGLNPSMEVTRGDVAEMLYRAKAIKDNFYPGLNHDFNREFEAEILVPAPLGVELSSSKRVKVLDVSDGFWMKLAADNLVLKGKVIDAGNYSDDCVDGLGTYCDTVHLMFYIDPVDRWKVYSLLDSFDISDDDYHSLKENLGKNFTIELDEIVNYLEGYGASEYELTFEN